jgi:dipicolinate synthase subunit A
MMFERNNIGIIGGDQRQLALAESIAGDGYKVFACGFENADLTENVQKANLHRTVSVCSTLLLPLPVTIDGETVKAEYAEHPILLNQKFAEKIQNHRVFGGVTERALSMCPRLADLKLQNYYSREDFALRNAVVTAEGALQYAMQEFPGTICGSKCLVAGFGRIGSQLVPRLRALGADVTATTRKPQTAARIEALGCHFVPTDRLGDGGNYDILFNTVPAMLFTSDVLAAYPHGTLLIDLSSAPGGVDMAAAKKLGIAAMHAFSLPAKVAPRAAGEIIKRTVYEMMKE